MVRFLTWLALALSLSACSVIEDRWQSVGDKINAAFPPPREIVEARAALFAGLQQQDAATHDAWLARWRQQLELRAQACGQGAGIGRFDTTEDARSKIRTPACFLEQDVKLAGWIGMHRVVRGLRQPPLVPLSAMPARVTLPVTQDFNYQVVAASAANVVSVRPTGTATLVVRSLPGGNVISSLRVPPKTTSHGILSPNGAIFAQPAGSSVSVPRGPCRFRPRSGCWSVRPAMSRYCSSRARPTARSPRSRCGSGPWSMA
jgi:hypothetical protein